MNIRPGRTYIIAEAGTCHAHVNPARRLPLAIEYSVAAAEAGADAVKFQMFTERPYDDMFCWLDGDEERSERWHNSFMSFSHWRDVKMRCDDMEVELLASVFQHRTIEWITRLGLPATKVASRATKNFPYGRGPKPYIVSTGMCGLPERDDVIGMECESVYPSMLWWRGREIGFSDHSGGVRRGAEAMIDRCQILEVHFYINPDDAGPDLPASLNLAQLEALCSLRDAISD